MRSLYLYTESWQPQSTASEKKPTTNLPNHIRISRYATLENSDVCGSTGRTSVYIEYIIRRGHEDFGGSVGMGIPWGFTQVFLWVGLWDG